MQRVVRVSLSTLFLCVLAVLVSAAAQAQTFTVLHNFSGPDGATPNAGVTIDRAGNLYGTTSMAGNHNCLNHEGCGTVFKLTHRGSGWTFATLYTFQGGSDGGNPLARVIIGSNGTLYGTTSLSGNNACISGCGTVFNLRPTPTFCPSISCPWQESQLYQFTGQPLDGDHPYEGDLVFDASGNLYGTTLQGGSGDGNIWELMPSNGGWMENVLYSFTGINDDGLAPWSGVIFDEAGNLYGTTSQGGLNNAGTVYELTPSGSGWTENILYIFLNQNDGEHPYGGLISDPSGNLYGTTGTGGGSGAGHGTVFEMTHTNGNWMLSVLYIFTDGNGPTGSLVMDAAGSLYGMRGRGGVNGFGSVFKLTFSNGSWTYTSLHDFTGGNDGDGPNGTLAFDAAGNLYGTTESGGTNSSGVIFEIMP